jgi:hypothetical protein
VEHRLRVELPEGVPTDKAEEFASDVAAELSPEMSGTFGAIHVEDGGGERDVWTALGWQEDGSSVYLRIDPPKRSVELHLNTHGLEPPVRRLRWSSWVLMGLLAVCVAAGVAVRSWLLALALGVVVLGAWAYLDLRGQAARERRRKIDADAWNQRLHKAVEHAQSSQE